MKTMENDIPSLLKNPLKPNMARAEAQQTQGIESITWIKM